MPVFEEASPDARLRVVQRGKGYQQREVYREHLSQLSDNRLWEIRPEGDETLRQLKVNVRRAANELDLNVRYGETQDGTLLVWAEDAPQKRRRGRPRKPQEASQIAR